MESNRKARFPIASAYGRTGAAKTAESEDHSYAGAVTTAAEIELTLAIVADGVGRNNLGQSAAQLTIESIVDYCRSSFETNIPILLSLAIDDANWRVYQEARAHDAQGQFSSTVALAAVVDQRLYVANVGSNRVDLIRDKRVRRLTVDHPWAADPAIASKPAREEGGGRLVRALGYEPNVRVEGLNPRGGRERSVEANRQPGLPLHRDDVVLVCSDGLTKTRSGDGQAYLSPEDMLNAIEAAGAQDAAQRLVDAAVAKGVDDDATAVVIEFSGRKSRSHRSLVQAGMAAIISVITIMALVAAIVYLIPRVPSPFPSATPLPTRTPLPPTPLPGSADILEGRVTSQVSGAAQEAVLQTGEHVRFGAGSTITAMNGPATLNLPGNCQVQVSGSPQQPSVVELFQSADLSAGQPVTKLRLYEGKLLVAGIEGADERVKVTVETISGSATALGTVMGIRFTPANRVLDVDCFEGHCLLQAGVSEISLAANEHASVDMRGVISAVDSILLENYSDVQLDRFLSEGAREQYWPQPPTETAPQAPTATSVPTYGGGFTWDDPFWNDSNRRAAINRGRLWPLSFILPVLFLVVLAARKMTPVKAFRGDRGRGLLARLVAAVHQTLLS